MIAVGANHFERQMLMSAGDRQAEIDLIEAAARDAWPAAQADWVGGWLLRYTYGITRRANSVWPNGDSHGISELTFDERLNEAELFYAVYDMPARFQISPASRPADLDIVLALRGYQRTAETAVQTAKLSVVLHETGRRSPGSVLQIDVAEQVEPGVVSDLRRHREVRQACRRGTTRHHQAYPG